MPKGSLRGSAPLTNRDFCLRREVFALPIPPAMIPPRTFSITRLLVLPLLVAGAIGQSGPKGGAPAGPLSAEVFIVKSAPFAQTLSTVGTLRANESVTLVSELSRRLVKIQVAGRLGCRGRAICFSNWMTATWWRELGEIDARMKLANINKKRVDTLLPRKAISQQEFDSLHLGAGPARSPAKHPGGPDFQNRNPRAVRRPGGRAPGQRGRFRLADHAADHAPGCLAHQSGFPAAGALRGRGEKRPEIHLHRRRQRPGFRRRGDRARTGDRRHHPQSVSPRLVRRAARVCCRADSPR